MFIDIEDDHNKLAFRFDPEEDLIEIKTPRMKSPQVYDLKKLRHLRDRLRSLQAIHCSSK